MIKHSRIMKSLAVAVTVSFALATAAEAGPRHYQGGGHYHGGHYRGGGNGAAIGLGIAGAILGGAMLAGAASQRYRCRVPVYDDYGDVVGYRRAWCE